MPFKEKGQNGAGKFRGIYNIRRRHGLRVINGLLIVFYVNPENGFYYILAWR